MKRTLLASLLLLTAASALLYWSLPEKRSPVPVLNWMTQNDEVKRETVRLFRQWLADNHLPPCDVHLDNSTQEPLKKLVQGVSGVGGDLIDLYFAELEIFQATGMLADVTAEARRDGYSLDRTYASARSDIEVLGRQYGFPRNVDVTLCFVNQDTFVRYGVPEPPARWDWDEFEQLGRRFVAAANPPGTRQRIFFMNRVWPPLLRRGLGLSLFNETMTRCTLDDPRNAEVLRRIKRWTVDLRLVPTQEEQNAMAADASGWDSAFALFATGRFAIIYDGLWSLIRLRPRGDFPIRAVEPFHSGFPNTETGCGVVAVYTGSKHPEQSRLFLKFLTSTPFNELIGRTGDSLPPVPAFVESDSFLHPPGPAGDSAVKSTAARMQREIGIAASKSPFVLPRVAYLIELENTQAVLASRLTPEEASRATADRLNAEIALTVQHDAALAKLYAERVELQKKIDARRAAGQPVPAAWISDPFHLAHYRAQGWLEKEAVP